LPASRRVEVEDLWDFDFADQFDLTLLDESLDFEETLSVLRELPSNRVILWVGRGASSVNEDGLPIQLIRQIVSLNVAPLLSMQSSTLQAGGLGGFMTVSKELGQKIAQLAYGQPNGFEPPTKRFVLDYNELEHWQADTSKLVEPVSIINEPLSIFTKTQVQLFIGIPLSIIALFFAMIAWWAWNQLNVRNRQLAKIESLDTQLHLALSTSKLALIEENLTTQTAKWIVAPPDQPRDPLVGAARLNATELEYRDRITDALDQIGLVVEYPLFIESLNTLKWVKNATISQHTNTKGEHIRVVLSQDVTDLKQNELALDKSVKQTNKLLRELEDTLQKQKQMFAVVGHELRTPASALHMMLEGDQNSITESISDIRSTSQHLITVLDDLRSVVEPELTQERSLSKARPLQIVESSLTPLKAMLAQNEMCCSVKSNQLAGEPFNLDQRGIRQVLTNFIKNACVHGQGSDIQVHVDVNAPVTAQEGAKHQLRIIVEDNGRGIEPSLYDSIFEPFERGETDADGTGLGLHICREIIKANGGTLKVTESESLGGASFVIEMPIELMRSATLDDETSTVSLQGLNVLMAEDNLMLRKLSENLLQKLGSQPVLVENGQLALDRFKKQHWDLVITDIFMPVMNGYELVAAIRKTGSDVKVLGVTAATVGNERDMLMQAGADVVMGKPITSETLQKALLQLQPKV
jgi:signal transduction histidine kinase/CheY-like chemotaxis protein